MASPALIEAYRLASEDASSPPQDRARYRWAWIEASTRAWLDRNSEAGPSMAPAIAMARSTLREAIHARHALASEHAVPIDPPIGDVPWA